LSFNLKYSGVDDLIFRIAIQGMVDVKFSGLKVEDGRELGIEIHASY
jgi:hypothetical protein